MFKLALSKILVPGKLIFEKRITGSGKNKKDLKYGEKQISYVMELLEIRKVSANEIEKLWPNNEGRWNYLAIGRNTRVLEHPFNLDELIGKEDAKWYVRPMNYAKIKEADERVILNHIK